MMPGVPCGATHSTLTSSSGASTVSPSHSLTRCGSPAISRQARENVAVGAVAGVQLGGDLPLDEERQLRVGDQAVDADLLPAQLGAVGAVAVAVGGLAAEPLLDDGDVVDRDDPAEPAAAERGAGAHRLAERRLVGGGVVEHLDDLEVGVAGQRQDHVAGAEAGMHAAVDEVRAEQSPEALGGAGQAIGSGGEGEVVQAHAVHCRQSRAPVRQRGRVVLTSRLSTTRRPGAQRGSAGWSASATATAGAPRSAAPARRTPRAPISSVSSGSWVT